MFKNKYHIYTNLLLFDYLLITLLIRFLSLFMEMGKPLLSTIFGIWVFWFPLQSHITIDTIRCWLYLKRYLLTFYPLN